MSFDLKLAWVYFGMALQVLFLLGAGWLIRWIIDAAIAHSGYRFYRSVYNEDPKCPTCPFRGRCPYANGKLCRFIKIANRHAAGSG